MQRDSHLGTEVIEDRIENPSRHDLNLNAIGITDPDVGQSQQPLSNTKGILNAPSPTVEVADLLGTELLWVKDIGQIAIPRGAPQHRDHPNRMTTGVRPVLPQVDNFVTVAVSLTQQPLSSMGRFLPLPGDKITLSLRELVKPGKGEKSQVKD